MYLVFGYGPLFAADTTFLEDYADVLLSYKDWHRNIDLSSPEGKHLAERMIGYPALIAFVKLFFGGVWATAIIAIQSLFSLLATVLLFRAVLRLTTSNGWALFGAFCYATSLPLIWDSFVFYDSILGSLMTVLMSSLVLIMLRDRPFLMSEAFTLGFLLAVAFLFKDVTLVIAFLFVPCIAYAATLRNERGWLSVIIFITLFITPVCITYLGYNAWNHNRSGEAFVTSAARSALVVPLLRMAAVGDDVFTGDTALVREARKEIDHPEFAKILDSRYAVVGPILRINKALLDKADSNVVQISKSIEQFYLKTVATHPVEILRYAITQVRPSLIRIFCQPIYGATFFYEVRTEPSDGDIGRLTRFHFLISKSMTDNSIWPLLLLGAELLARLVAISLGVSLILVLPIWSIIALIRPAVRFGDFHISILLAIVFAGIVSLYSLIHIEPRYLLSALSAGILSAIPVLAKITGMLARRAYGQPAAYQGEKSG